MTYPDGSIARKVRSSIRLWCMWRVPNMLHQRYHKQFLYVRDHIALTDSYQSSHHVPEVATALGTLHRTIPLVSHMTLHETESPHLDLVNRTLNH
jgi:hypothetical protein